MKKLVFILLVLPAMLWADNLTISNETDRTVYAAVYYVPTFGQVTKASEILTLSPGANMKIERPGQRLGSDRELLILSTLNFSPTYTKSSFKIIGPRINVGQLYGKRFYIGEEEGALRGYTVGQWEQRGKTGVLAALKGTASTLAATSKAQVSRTYKAVVPDVIQEKITATALKGLEAYWDSPYKNQVANVRVGSGVSPQERAVLGKRMQKTRSAMEAKLGKINRPPKIAIVASGGGYRAMIFTTGFMAGAYKAGLWDMATWMTALSGGTWAMGAFYENNAKKGRTNPAQFRTQFLDMIKDKRIERPLSPNDIKLMTDLFRVDILAGKPFTFVNLYGAALANRVFENFGDAKQTLLLSDQASLVDSGDLPVPIYTAVSGEEGQPEYYWYGFTPWEVSMEPWTQGGISISVPTWGYGRKFRNGASTEYLPEMSLGFQLGTYGSAFAADVDRMYSEISGKMPQPVKGVVEKVLISKVGGKRLTWAAVPNFGRGVTESPLRSEDGLQLVDAGLAFNLPYPPVSGMRAERTADIIILVDASDPIEGAREFKLVEKYARSKGLKFPKVDYSVVHKKGVSIWEDKSDPSVPMIIYVPQINDENQTALLNKPSLQQYKNILTGFDSVQCTKKSVCGTFNFKYSADEALKLSTLGEFNVMAYIDEIYAAIKRRAATA